MKLSQKEAQAAITQKLAKGEPIPGYLVTAILGDQRTSVSAEAGRAAIKDSTHAE